MTELQAILQENKKLIDETILEVLPKYHPIREIELLYQMMRDYPMRPAKGLRSSFCLLTSAAFGGDVKKALLTATALELFQNWILIHDDVEDASELRRGEPVLQKKYNIPLAINAGDALHGKMWEVLTKNRDTLGETVTMIIVEEFLNMISETTEGQHMELSWVERRNWSISEQDYLTMCRKKTAWYTCITPARLGFLISPEGPKLRKDDFVKFGESLGVAFQIRDDVLNLSAEGNYGKERAGDILEGKRSLILIHLINSATEIEKARIKEILGKERVSKEESDVSEVLELIRKYGSIDYAKKMAFDLSKVALDEFENIFGRLKNGKEKSGLREITEYMVTRDW